MIYSLMVLASSYMKKILSTPLQHDVAREFCVKTLAEGHVLAHELLKTLNFEEGHFFAITSVRADVSKLGQLFYGGIRPVNPREKVKVSGKEYFFRKKGTSTEELASFLNQSLPKDNQHWCVFEEVAFEKGDECLSRVKSKIRYFEKKAYYFLCGVDCSEEKLISLIKTADAQWYYMNVITQAVIQPNHQQLLLKDINMLAANTTYLTLGAYDMEGYVCWEKVTT